MSFPEANMWRPREWQPTPVLLPGESQGWRSLEGCRLWGRTELDTTEATAAAAAAGCNSSHTTRYGVSGDDREIG